MKKEELNIEEKKLLRVIKMIRIARHFIKMTQKELGEKLGISGSAVSDIESGKTEITVRYLLKLATIYDAPITLFFNHNNNAIPFGPWDDNNKMCVEHSEQTSKIAVKSAKSQNT